MMRLVPTLVAMGFASGLAAQAIDYPNYQLESAPLDLGAINPDNDDLRESIVAGLSDDAVAITASFTGDEILIYGAIKREEPVPEGLPLNVIVTVEGPSLPVTIRRKERRAGIWINTESVTVGGAPSYYMVASDLPLPVILEPAQDEIYRISIPYAMRGYSGIVEVDDASNFTNAMVELRKDAGYYVENYYGVRVVDQTLFRADIKLPASLIEGDYRTRIFLLRDGKVIDTQSAPILVRKVGIERFLYQLAYDQPLLYGLLSLFVAVAAGWGASSVFRMLRRG